MEEKSKTESVLQHLNTYLETRWNLFVLSTSDKVSDIVSTFAAALLIALSIIFVLFFLSISAALWIGQSYGDFSIGFLYVGLFYLILTIVIFIFRKMLFKVPIVNMLIRTFYSDDEN